MTDLSTGTIDSRDDFKNTPRGQYDYWMEELKASQKSREDWHKQADKIVMAFLDQRRKDVGRNFEYAMPFNLNLFHANVTTLMSMLYGNIPTVDVSRRYADPNDDISRVAAEIMERLLNNDIAENGEEINSVLRSTLQDRLIPGLGCARVRYEVETETTTVITEEGVSAQTERIVKEDAPLDYFFWRDVLWSWGRNWSELTWLGYRVYMTKDEVSERFGEEAAEQLEYKKQVVQDEQTSFDDPDMSSVWNKAEVWEIWDKTRRQVVFVSKGYRRVLETKEDPLQLTGFFPSPPFFIANPTTTLYAPVPDYHLAQDLYNEINKLQTRIAIITEAVKVVGVYNSEAEGIQRVFQEGVDNTLIPVSNWAIWAEKGGNAGQIDWVPLADIVNALDKLRDLRNETIDLLYQVTGMADVLRGGGAGQYEGVGQAALKAKFGSVRVQALQDEFATFASNLMQIKAEIISRHFSPETIAKRSNIQNSFDADLALPAIELIKTPQEARLKVEIRAESVAMVDYAQLKAERTEYISSIAVFMQSAAPMIESDPNMKPFLLQLLQWGLAGFKGSSEIEGVVDKAISTSESEAQEQRPDPEQQRMQAAMQLEQMKAQAKMQEIQAKSEADAKIRQFDLQADIQTTFANHRAKLGEIEADMQAAIAETRAKMEADLLMERAQAEANIAQTNEAAKAEIQKDAIGNQMEIEKEANKTLLKLDEIAAVSASKIQEAEAKSTEDTSD